MHNRTDCCKLVRFTPLSEMPEREAEFLDETFDVVAVNYTDDGLEEYVCYAPLGFDIKTFDTRVAALNLTLPPYTIETLESKNWLTANVIKFAPFEIGSFMIYGIHEATCPKTDKIPVQVYAATAFGSEHQTTRMCLSAISDLHAQNVAPKRIMDMGTGSGILSIAAAKIWKKTPLIIAADIDPESVDVTHSNAITNDVEQNITALLSDGYNNPMVKNNAPYDLILANILLNPLKAMSNDAYNALKDGGYYLISGFIDNQLEDVINCHQAIGFKLVKVYEEENWRAALLQK